MMCDRIFFPFSSFFDKTEMLLKKNSCELYQRGVDSAQVAAVGLVLALTLKMALSLSSSASPTLKEYFRPATSEPERGGVGVGAR